MHRHLILLAVIACAAAAVNAPDDPLWARIITADAGRFEVAVSGRQRLVQDPYGYLAILPVGATWDTVSGDWSGGINVRMRYIPYRGTNSSGSEVTMPPGVPVGGLYHAGSRPDDLFATYTEGPAQYAVDTAVPGIAGEGSDRLAEVAANGMWMCENEVDQQTWQVLWSATGLGLEHFDTPQFPADDRPVERVTRAAVTAWLTQLNTAIAAQFAIAAPGDPAPVSRLPNETEWEYACRAGGSSAYWAGPSLAPVDWEIDRLPAGGDHTYNGRTHTDLSSIVEKRWNDKATTADQEKYLQGRYIQVQMRSNVSLGAETSSNVHYLDEVIVPVQVTVRFRDYFIFEPNNPIEANIDSRHRPKPVADCYGAYVAVVRRFRRLDTNHYIEDPTVSDADCYVRLAERSPIGADGQTPDGDFIDYDSTSDGIDFAYHKVGPGIDVWNPHVHGDHRWIDSNNNNEVEEHEVAALEIVRFVPGDRRLAAVTVNPDPTNPAHFTPDPMGDWIDCSFAGQRRFQVAVATYNIGRYDTAGSFWGCTVPGEPLSGFDRGDVEAVIRSIPLPHVVGANSGIVGINDVATALSSIDEDVDELIADIKAQHPYGTYTLYNDDPTKVWYKKGVFSRYTKWTAKVTVTISWSSIDSLRRSDGHDQDNDGNYDGNGWAGFDLGALTNDYITPNPWGLYHMHGNVAEWTSTDWDGISDRATPVAMAGQAVVKGGSWRRGAPYARGAARERRAADISSPNLFKHWDVDRNGTIDADEHNAVGVFSLPGYDDVGFRFIIPE